MTKRCFIAINLPQAVRWELEALIFDLKKINNNPAVKFVDKNNLHLTLQFLDALDENQIGQVDELLTKIAVKYPPAEILTQGFGAFPDLKNPQTLYLAAKETSPNILAKMQKEISTELSKIGILTEQKNWTPHITLARLKKPVRIRLECQALSELSVPVESLELIESELADSEPIHKVIESYKLKM